jgi:hypothetical protein
MPSTGQYRVVQYVLFSCRRRRRVKGPKLILDSLSFQLLFLFMSQLHVQGHDDRHCVRK